MLVAGTKSCEYELLSAYFCRPRKDGTVGDRSTGGVTCAMSAAPTVRGVCQRWVGRVAGMGEEGWGRAQHCSVYYVDW